MEESNRSDTPPKNHKDDRAPTAQAMGIAYELMSISLEMALVPLGGYWLDKKFETAPLFLLLGCLIGFSLGLYHLMQFASSKKKRR